MSNWGRVRLEGDDDLSVGGSYVRNLGMGIEGRPGANVSATGGIENLAMSPTPAPRTVRRSSGISWSSGKATVNASGVLKNGKGRQASSSSAFSAPAPSDEDLDAGVDPNERRDRQVLTTLALLQTFHANTCFQLSRLQTFLPPSVGPNPVAESGTSPSRDTGTTVYLTPKDLLSLELGPLSAFDARYLGWLVDEYGGGTTVIVKRGWRDLLGMVFGYS